jgi:hypothetical protein
MEALALIASLSAKEHSDEKDTVRIFKDESTRFYVLLELTTSLARHMIVDTFDDRTLKEIKVLKQVHVTPSPSLCCYSLTMTMMMVMMMMSILTSASCSFYSYIPHYPSPSPLLPSLYPYCNPQRLTSRCIDPECEYSRLKAAQIRTSFIGQPNSNLIEDEQGTSPPASDVLLQ